MDINRYTIHDLMSIADVEGTPLCAYIDNGPPVTGNQFFWLEDGQTVELIYDDGRNEQRGVVTV